MKRREILKMLGVSTLSLMGIERLAKAMASTKLSSIEVCTGEIEVACVVSASTGGEYYLSSCTNDICPNVFRCNGRSTDFYCNSSFNCAIQHTCDPQAAAGDFRCNNLFTCGLMQATGTFTCSGGVDTGLNDAQFVCFGTFSGCHDYRPFFCSDFKCQGTYNCGAGHAGCPNPLPTGRVVCEPNYHS